MFGLRYNASMKITRKSTLSGIVRTKEINITEQQLQQWKAGKNIQWLCPQLTPDEREFLLTGATPAEWDEAFKGLE
jgi:hypothetical protein